MKFTVGGGLYGSIRHTRDSTLGGGLKLFLPTFNSCCVLASNCVFTDKRQYKLSPGLFLSHPESNPLGAQSLGEFLLEHEHSSTEEGTVLKKLKNDTRRNDVGNVCHTEIEVRKLHLQEVTVNDLQMGCIFAMNDYQQLSLRSLHFLLHFIDHARI